MSDLTPKQTYLRGILDKLTHQCGPAPTARSTEYVASSEILSLLDECSVPYSQARNRKPLKLGYKSCYMLSFGDALVASVPTGSVEFIQTVLKEGLGIRMKASSIRAKLHFALLSESEAARLETAVDAGNGMLLGLLRVELDSTNGPFGASEMGIHCNDDVLAEVKARIAERYALTAIGAPSVELNKDNRSAFGMGFAGQSLSALLKGGAEDALALFNGVNLACIDLSHAQNPLEAFRIIASLTLLNAPKYDGDFDSVSLNARDSEVGPGGAEWGKLAHAGPNRKLVKIFCHPRGNASLKRNAELEAYIKPFLVALKGLCQCAEKTLGGDDFANKWATKYVPWMINILTAKAKFDKGDYGVLLELWLIKNKMEVLEDAQPVEQRPAQIARSEASADVSDESRAALFEKARTTSLWNVVSPHIMPFLGHFEW